MTDQQQLARGKNVMLSLLEKRLSVPRIYLDAEWQGQRVDILAIDRDGSGDVHIVLAYARPLMEDLPDTPQDKVEIEQLLERLSGMKAQYKYVLGVATASKWKMFGNHPADEFSERTFSPDGLGRVGLALAAPDETGNMTANLVFFPERFRAFIAASADEFVRKHAADLELRA